MQMDPHSRTRRPPSRLERLVLPATVAGAAAVLLVAIGGLVARPASGTSSADGARIRALTSQLALFQRQAREAQEGTAGRDRAVLAFSAKYQIPADLAGAIHDIAVDEGLDPALAFRLVKIESDFDGTSRSPRGAIGYTQVRAATAQQYLPGTEERHLYARDVNLRVGFRYLKDLLRQFGGDMDLALVAYNRGPTRVQEILAAGGDPSNGYAEAVRTGKRSALKPPAEPLPPAPVITGPES